MKIKKLTALTVLVAALVLLGLADLAAYAITGLPILGLM
jgi:hypothetical protein